MIAFAERQSRRDPFTEPRTFDSVDQYLAHCADAILRGQAPLQPTTVEQQEAARATFPECDWHWRPAADPEPIPADQRARFLRFVREHADDVREILGGCW